MDAVTLPRRYALEERVSRRLLLATDRLFDRPVALKLTVGAEPRQREELAREHDVLSAFRHPGLPRVHDFGRLADGRSYLALERIGGRRLVGPLSSSDLRAVVRGACETLSLLHARGLVHGDLKPAHLRLDTRAGRVVLLDLGLAAVSGVASGVRGTVGYMAPEVVSSGRTAERSDLYSLGVLLYELATGTRPFQGDETDVLRAQAERAPETASRRRPELPQAFCGVLACLLDPDARRRPGDAREASARLLAGLDGEAGPQALPRPHFTAAFVGREAEMDEAWRALELARTGAVRIALAGRDGAGCTRLLEELQARCRVHDVPALRWSLAERAWSASELPRQLELLLDLDVGGGDRRSAADAGIAAVQRSVDGLRGRGVEAPLVLLADDLEQAGPDARRAIEALWDQLPPAGVLLLTSHAAGETEWPPAGGPTIELSALSDAAVEGFLGSALRGEVPAKLLDRVRDADVRRPRALLDVVRRNVESGALVAAGCEWHVLGVLDVEGDGPDDDCLAGLDTPARQLAAGLVVLERPASIDDLGRLAGLDRRSRAEAVSRLVARGLAVHEGDDLRPTSRLTCGSSRVFAVTDLRPLHDEAARLLDAGSPAAPAHWGAATRGVDEALLRHRALGTDARTAMVACAELAVRRLRVGDVERAATLAAEGLSREGEPSGPGAPSEVLAARRAAIVQLHHVLAECHHRLGRLQHALEEREAALAAARDAGRSDLVATALRELGQAQARCGELWAARRSLEAALALGQAAEESEGDAVAGVAAVRAGSRASVLVELAEIHRRLGEGVEAERRLAEASGLHARSRDRGGEGQVLVARARLATRRGDYRAARDMLRAAEACFEEVGDAAAAANAVRELGWVLYLSGDGHAAARTLRTALNVAEKLGSLPMVADVLNVLGAVSADEGRVAEAVAHHREALRAFERIGDVKGQLAAGNNLGWELFVSGDVHGALDAYRRVLELQDGLGQGSGAGMTRNNLGIALCASAEYAEALSCCEAALAQAESSQDRRLESEACWGLGRVYAALGATSDGVRWQRRAAEIALRIGNPLDHSLALSELGPLHLREGNVPAATPRGSPSLREAMRARSRGQVALARVRLGRARVLQGRLGEGLSQLRDGLAEARATGDRLAELEGCRELGSLTCELGDFDSGIALIQESLAGTRQCGYFQELPAAHEALARAYLRKAVRLKTSTGAVVERPLLDEAQRHVDAGLDLTAATGRVADRAALAVTGAEAYVLAGEARRALAEAEQAHQLAMEAGDLLVAARARLVRADALLAAREFGAALGEGRTASEGFEKMGLPELAWRAHALLMRVHRAWGMAREQADETRAAEALLRRLAASLGEPAQAAAYLADVERRAVLAPLPGRGGSHLRRFVPTEITSERFAGNVDADELLDALLAAQGRLREVEARHASARRRLSEACARRRLMEDCARLVGAAETEGTTLESVLDAVRRGLGAERAFFLEDGGDGLHVRASAGAGGRSVELADYSVSLGIVKEVLETGRPTVTGDARSDRRFGDRTSVRALELRSLACAPLRWAGAVRGVLCVDDSLTEGSFRPRDARTLAAVADLLGPLVASHRAVEDDVDPSADERRPELVRG